MPVLFNAVQDFFQEARLLGTSGIVAISGGPDSVALAHVLVGMVRDGQLSRLVLAHVNHQLRGADSDADEAFVAGLVEAWRCAGLSACTMRSDVAAKAKRERENLEKTAREVRYDWLARVAEEEGAGWVATGHSADDQAETVMHRLLRGTGLQGLAGIHRRRQLRGNVDLVRPLLGVRRADILAYLAEVGQDYRIDESNRDRRFTRNRIRHELLPLLVEHYQPAIVEVLASLAEQAWLTHADLLDEVRVALSRAELPRAGDILVFDLARLSEISELRLCELFRLVWDREGWPRGAMDRRAWLRFVELVRGDLPVHDFPGRIRARRVGHVLQLVRPARTPNTAL